MKLIFAFTTSCKRHELELNCFPFSDHCWSTSKAGLEIWLGRMMRKRPFSVSDTQSLPYWQQQPLPFLSILSSSKWEVRIRSWIQTNSGSCIRHWEYILMFWSWNVLSSLTQISKVCLQKLLQRNAIQFTTLYLLLGLTTLEEWLGWSGCGLHVAMDSCYKRKINSEYYEL